MNDIRKFFNRCSRENIMDNFTNDEEKKLKNIMKKIKINKNAKVLDLGCGSGRFLKFLKKFYGLKKIIGMDISEGMIFKAKSKKNLFIIGCAENIPFKKNKFEFVFLFNVFPHILNKEKALKQIESSLNENGSFIIIHLEPREKINKIHKSIGGVIENHKIPSKYEMIKILKNASFKNLEIKNSKAGYFATGIKKLK